MISALQPHPRVHHVHAASNLAYLSHSLICTWHHQIHPIAHCYLSVSNLARQWSDQDRPFNQSIVDFHSLTFSFDSLIACSLF